LFCIFCSIFASHFVRNRTVSYTIQDSLT
jgi:uncharacterized Fe-S cluster-containing radical SAM superfamily enzyme